MATVDEVRQQVAALDGASRWLACREIKALPGLLWEDERVERLAQGVYKGGFGLLVATNKRLIFVDKGLIYGIRVEDFPYDKITSIEYQTGILLGEITIHASGNRARIEQVDKRQAAAFADFVRARTTPVFHRPAAHGAGSASADDVVSKLERLAALRVAGVLTEQEFTDQKRRILAS